MSAVDETNEHRTEVVLTLLQEYAEKLRARSREFVEAAYIRRKRSRYYLNLYFFPIVTAAASGIAVFHLSGSSDYAIVAAVAMGGVSFICFLSLLARTTRLWSDGEFEASFADLETLTNQVERVVRAVSQSEEHASLPPEEKLRSDLRLTEAEGALRYFADVVKPLYEADHERFTSTPRSSTASRTPRSA